MIALDSSANPAFGIMPYHVQSFVGMGLEGFKIKNPYGAPINSHEHYLKLRISDDKKAKRENPYYRNFMEPKDDKGERHLKRQSFMRKG